MNYMLLIADFRNEAGDVIKSEMICLELKIYDTLCKIDEFTRALKKELEYKGCNIYIACVEIDEQEKKEAEFPEDNSVVLAHFRNEARVDLSAKMDDK